MHRCITVGFTFWRDTLISLTVVLCVSASGFVAGTASAQGRVIRILSPSIPGSFVDRQIEVPFVLESLGNESSIGFSLTYNYFGLRNPAVVLGNDVPAGSTLPVNTANQGKGQLGILINSTGGAYAAGTRNIITITFTVPGGTLAGGYGIVFGGVPVVQSVSNAAGEQLQTTYWNGAVIIGAAAASVNVSGRVLTSDGRGIRNATVAISDANGNRHVATTGSFGNYYFADIEAGRAYTISVESKRFRFTPRLLQILDSLRDVDFPSIK